jgi:hypothetical protein
MVRGDASIAAGDQMLSRQRKSAMGDDAGAFSEDYNVPNAARRAVTQRDADQRAIRK